MANVTWEYRVIPITGETAGGEMKPSSRNWINWEAKGGNWSRSNRQDLQLSTYSRGVSRPDRMRKGDEDNDEDGEYDDEIHEDGTIRINPPSGQR
jgi:hypothetical protein